MDDTRSLKQLSEDEPLIVRVQDLSRAGAGVARDASGRVLFIPFSAPGDLVKVRLTEKVLKKKSYAYAEIIEILEPSPSRVSAPCAVFGKCGGCQWQHLPYTLQWQTKVKGVVEALSKNRVSYLGKIEEVPAEKVFGYRNRIQLRGVGRRLGFFRAEANELVETDRCEIAREELNQVWGSIRDKGEQMKAPFKVEIEVLPNFQIRESWNACHGALGFRQVHDEQNEKLKTWVRENLQDASVLYDLYGGAGNFSLFLAPDVSEVHCVDVTAPSKRPEGAPRNVFFYNERVEKWIRKKQAFLRTPKDLEKAEQSLSKKKAVAIVDPPRRGLGEDLDLIQKTLREMGVSEVIAIGCDVDSWVRDLRQWTYHSWKIRKLMAIDLFPQTSHVEAVAMLVV